jgi:hypothetical protein
MAAVVMAFFSIFFRDKTVVGRDETPALAAAK